ncbi:uncharacterized protein BJ171DRAFT_55658 [Polychytrium aggregatum]|uniref:uncharacterized protein n=1 Tax=Polychytrium aggregatum TaxID=110093 RepID=UPI0022FE0AFF|nr:uncharacterized protein BJ171DRAFT_55658 [Polychytrium aggregatum]KAI9205962.1 hypothetical protein BJ171DRAFT_55658 [Polychytrium aggregatum]
MASLTSQSSQNSVSSRLSSIPPTAMSNISVLLGYGRISTSTTSSKPPQPVSITRLYNITAEATALNLLLSSRVPLIYFLTYLLTKYSVELLFFAIDVQRYWENDHEDVEAVLIYQTYLDSSSTLEINVTDKAKRVVKDGMKEILSTMTPSLTPDLGRDDKNLIDPLIFQQAYNEVFELLTKHYTAFMTSRSKFLSLYISKFDKLISRVTTLGGKYKLMNLKADPVTKAAVKVLTQVLDITFPKPSIEEEEEEDEDGDPARDSFLGPDHPRGYASEAAQLWGNHATLMRNQIEFWLEDRLALKLR